MGSGGAGGDRLAPTPNPAGPDLIRYGCCITQGRSGPQKSPAGPLHTVRSDFADDPGTPIQIRLFSHSGCSDRILVLVLVRPRRPDFQTLIVNSMDLIVLLLTFAAGVGIGYVLRDWVSQRRRFQASRKRDQKIEPARLLDFEIGRMKDVWRALRNLPPP